MLEAIECSVGEVCYCSSCDLGISRQNREFAHIKGGHLLSSLPDEMVMD